MDLELAVRSYVLGTWNWEPGDQEMGTGDGGLEMGIYDLELGIRYWRVRIYLWDVGVGWVE